MNFHTVSNTATTISDVGESWAVLNSLWRDSNVTCGAASDRVGSTASHSKDTVATLGTSGLSQLFMAEG